MPALRIALFVGGAGERDGGRAFIHVPLSGPGDRNTEFSAYIKSYGESLMAASCKCARVLSGPPSYSLSLSLCLSICSAQEGIPAEGSSRGRILSGGFSEAGAHLAQRENDIIRVILLIATENENSVVWHGISGADVSVIPRTSRKRAARKYSSAQSNQSGTNINE